MKINSKILQEKTGMYEYLFENANDGIVFIDIDTVIRASNKKIEDLFGYARDEIIGKSFTEFPVFNPDNMRETMDLFRYALEGELPPLIEFEGIHKDGMMFHLEINPTIIKQDDDVVGILAIIRDTRARKRLEQERARLIDIVEATPDFVFTYDSDGKITYINQAARNRLGLDTSEDLTMDDLPRIPEKSSTLIGPDIWSGESCIRLKDDSRLHVVHVVMKHCKNVSKEPFYSMIMKDITEQKQKENHIKFLTHHLMRIQEGERSRISRDLHDLLAQDLSSLKIVCESLLKDGADLPDFIRGKLSDMSVMFKKSIDSVRDVAYNLRLPNLLDLGLENAIKKFCEEFQDDHMEVTFFSAGMHCVNLDFDTKINLFRIVQEAFNNVKKHARADRISLILTASYPKVILRIEDNGVGFDLNRRKRDLTLEKRMGLTSMEERVELLNGTFRIKTKSCVGTLIHVEIPIHTKWNSQDDPGFSVAPEGKVKTGFEYET